MFQLLVWSVRSLRGLFCTYEKTAVATEYSEIVGLEEVEVFLPLTRLPISECKKDNRSPPLCHQIFGSVNPDPEPFIFFGSIAGSEAVRSSSSGPSPGSEAVHFLWVRHRTCSRPFIFFGSSSEPELSVIFSKICNRIQSRTAVWAAYRNLVELTIPTLIHQVV